MDRRTFESGRRTSLKVHRLYFNVGTYLREFEPWVDEIHSREDFTFERVAPDRFLYGERPADPRDRRATGSRAPAPTTSRSACASPTGPSHAETLAAIERFGARGHRGV